MSILMFLSLAYNLLAYVETTKVIKISDNILSLTLQDSPKLLDTLFDIDKQKLTDDELIGVYIGLMDYYIGEGPGEVLFEKITSMQEKILPYLVEKKNTPLRCLEKYKSRCWENEKERNRIIEEILIDNIKKGIIFYPEFPASLKAEHERDLKIIRIFIQDYRSKKGILPNNLDNLREYAWHEYGYKLKIYSPWFGKPIKYVPQKDGKYILEAGDDKPKNN